MNDTSEVLVALREYVRSELLIPPDYPLSDDEPLLRGGLIDSFSIAHLGVFIESTFGVYISDVDLAEGGLDSVASIAARVVESTRAR